MPLKNPKKGVVRYHYVSSKNDSVYAELDFYSQKIINNKKTNYYSYIPTAMCAFGKKKISFKNLNTKSTYFNFLHGEKLTLIYDRKRKKQNLTFDGYLRQKEIYPIMEDTN